LNGTILGLSRKEIERRFDEIVDFSGLEQFIDTPIKRYSSGMIVRLGFAVASCIEPEILLVDEVLAVGDASFQQKCLRRINSLINHGTSIIFVSHNIYLIRAACNIALYLQNGRIKFFGSIKDGYDMYEKHLHQERVRKLDHFDRVGIGDDVVEITQIDVLAEDGSVVEVLPSDRPVKIQILYTAYKSLGKVQLSAFIFRSDGVTCCMMRTKLDGFDIVLEQGQGVVLLQLEPLQLVGGTYYVEAGFLDESDSTSITSKTYRSDWFTVKGKAMSYNEKSVFEPNIRWEHYKNIETVSENISFHQNSKPI